MKTLSLKVIRNDFYMKNNRVVRGKEGILYREHSVLPGKLSTNKQHAISVRTCLSLHTQ